MMQGESSLMNELPVIPWDVVFTPLGSFVVSQCEHEMDWN